MASRDGRLKRLVPEGEAALLERILSGAAGKWRHRLAMGSGLVRQALLALQNRMVPGISAHYLVRKRRIEQAVREALQQGIAQVVVTGAGFDTLAWRLHREFPEVAFFELDHPATQRVKKRMLGETASFHYQAADLTRQSPGAALAGSAAYDPDQPAVCIAEGLTMYLTSERVEALLTDLARVAGSAGRLIFTFMERAADGSIDFRNQHPLVGWWLRLKKEPFLWGASCGALLKLLRVNGLGGAQIIDDRQLREEILVPRGLGDLPLARGECLCLCHPVVLP